MTKHKKPKEKAEKKAKTGREDYLDDLKRVQADFENYIKRAEKQQEEFKKYANADILLYLINLKEDFERALKELEKMEKKDILGGIEMIYSNLSKILRNNGIHEIKAMGEQLDPLKHEVLQFKEGEKEGIVLEEVQKGFMIHEKVLRPSKVIVSRKEAVKEDSK